MHYKIVELSKGADGTVKYQLFADGTLLATETYSKIEEVIEKRLRDYDTLEDVYLSGRIVQYTALDFHRERKNWRKFIEAER